MSSMSAIVDQEIKIQPFLRKSPDILQSCIFHIHFMEHLIWNLFPPRGFQCSFLQYSSATALLSSWRWFCNGSLWHSVPVSSTTAFISGLYLHLNSWVVLLLDYLSLIADNCLVLCEPRRTVIENCFSAPKLPFICVAKRCLLLHFWIKFEPFAFKWL